MTDKKNKCYVGTVSLSYRGKRYGATTRQVCAKDRNEAKKKLKKRMNYKGNKVNITKLKLLKTVKKRGY